MQLTTTGTPAKPWLGVAQAPDGRTAAVYNNDPSGNASTRLQWFKVWDRNGNEIKDLPLQSKNVGTFVNRPLSFEISDDGDWTVNEWSYCQGGYSGTMFYNCLSLPHGAWLTLTTQINLLDPLEISGARQMTFYGNRLVFSDGSAISVQKAASAPGGTDSDLWISPPSGYAFERADIPANGGKVALELYQSGGTPQNIVSVASVHRRRRHRHGRLRQRLRPPRERERPQRRVVSRRVADRLARRPGPEGRGRAGPAVADGDAVHVHLAAGPHQRRRARRTAPTGRGSLLPHDRRAELRRRRRRGDPRGAGRGPPVAAAGGRARGSRRRRPPA